MKTYQNQLDRFRDIAKRLVDDHSAEVFTKSRLGPSNGLDETFYNHLDVLDKQLSEQAEKFIGTGKAGSEDLKLDIRATCKRYIDQFMRRNQPNV